MKKFIEGAFVQIRSVPMMGVKTFQHCGYLTADLIEGHGFSIAKYQKNNVHFTAMESVISDNGKTILVTCGGRKMFIHLLAEAEKA